MGAPAPSSSAGLFASLDSAPLNRQHLTRDVELFAGHRFGECVLELPDEVLISHEHQGIHRSPSRGDHLIFFWTQVMIMAVGLLGLGMHMSADLSGTGELNLERLINFAPVYVPLLFTNLGFLALISVLRPAESP